MNAIQVGDSVKLLGLPDWLIHDLPKSEQVEMRSFVGQCAVIEDVDANGYFWLGFGTTTIEADGTSRYSGHSFCVPETFIKLADKI